MPGRVYEIYYSFPPKGRWVSHLVDITFLNAWLRHPNFHMIK